MGFPMVENLLWGVSIVSVSCIFGYKHIYIYINTHTYVLDSPYFRNVMRLPFTIAPSCGSLV